MRWWAHLPLGLAACTRPNPGFVTEGSGASSVGSSTGAASSGTTDGTLTPTGGSQSGTGTADTSATDPSTTDPVASTGDSTTSTSTTAGSTGCADNCECTPGESKDCYTDVPSTQGVGVCKSGTQTCGRDHMFGPCIDEITPSPEICGDGLDNECDSVGIDLCGPLAEGCPDHEALIACYTFPKAAAKLLDGSGYQRDGTLTNVADTPSLMNFGNAGDFKGTGHADVPEHPAFSPSKLTISALVRPSIAGGFLVDKDNQYALILDPGLVSCQIVTKVGATDTVTSVLPAGKWSHVACVYDGATISLHVHTAGLPPELVGVAQLAGPLGPTSGTGLTLGADNPSHDLHFTGQLDHVLFFSDALAEPVLCELDPFCN